MAETQSIDLVAVAEEALEGSASWGAPNWRAEAEAVVAALVPRIRASIAAEVQVWEPPFSYGPGTGRTFADACPEGEGAAIRWAQRLIAASIVEGQPQ